MSAPSCGVAEVVCEVVFMAGHGMACRVASGPVKACPVKARRGTFHMRFGVDEAGRGRSSPGGAEFGVSRQGEGCLQIWSVLGASGRVVEWHVKAWRGLAGQGKARDVLHEIWSDLGKSGHGEAGHGWVRRVGAGPVTARQGPFYRFGVFGAWRVLASQVAAGQATARVVFCRSVR